MVADSNDIDPLEFRYGFTLKDGTTDSFAVRLDEYTLAIVGGPSGDLPDWTALDYHQCPDCPLTKDKSPRCPVAANISPIVERYKDVPSTVTAEILISTATRRFAKRAPISDGLGALLGLHMVASGCPVLDKLRPMARTHLPFATHEETMYRVLSMYLLAQLFRKQAGETPDWELDGLASLMDRLRDVNRSFCDRIKRVCRGDAVLNAMVLLDCYAGITSLELKTKELPRIRKIFAGYTGPETEARA